MSFGECIRQLRESRQLSLVELANHARIPSRTLALIEDDNHFPRLPELERLLAALQVRFSDLRVFAGEGHN
ncbi:MAG TPA: helix-turn-helix transcriptional regulator [Gammaproteobacteria bacterium]